MTEIQTEIQKWTSKVNYIPVIHCHHYDSFDSFYRN